MSARAVAMIAYREFRERWLLLPTALLVGLAPVALASAYGRADVADMRQVLGGFYLIAFTLVAAGLVGASLAGRDLAERRLGFFFTRPLHWSDVFLGKALAATMLVGLAIAALVLPLLPDATEILARFAADPVGFLTGPIPANLSVVLLAGCVGAGFFGISFRIRSKWLLLDLLGWMGLVLLARAALQRLLANALFLNPTPAITTAVCVALAIPLLLGLAAQLARGRGDPVRAHRAFSVTCWSVLLVASVAGAFAFERVVAGSVDRPTLDDRQVLSPDGRWRAVATRNAPWLHGGTRFLQRVGGVAVYRLGPAWLTTVPAFSPGSERAAWRAWTFGPNPHETWTVVDLLPEGMREVRVIETGRSVAGWSTGALSDGGRLLAAVGRWDVRVYDVDAGRVRHEATLPRQSGLVARAWFLGSDTLCLGTAPLRGAHRLDSYRLDLTDGALHAVRPGEPDACDFEKGASS